LLCQGTIARVVVPGFGKRIFNFGVFPGANEVANPYIRDFLQHIRDSEHYICEKTNISAKKSLYLRKIKFIRDTPKYGYPKPASFAF
jgi:hypothetical protein